MIAQRPPIETIDPSLPPATRSAARGTAGLKQILAERKSDGIIVGTRRDEVGTLRGQFSLNSVASTP